MDEQAGERWQTRITSLKDGIAHIYETKEFYDVIFWVHGEEFKAHKLVLAARSSVFSRQLLKPYEINEIIVDEMTVTITGFELLLRFIYTDILGTIDKKCVIQAYIAALYYEQTSLQDNCKDEIHSWVITTDEVFILLDTGSSIDILRGKCLQYIMNHAQEVIFSSAFESASLKSLCIVLKSGSLNNVSPLEQIKQVMKWGAKRHSVSDDFSVVRKELHSCSLLGTLAFEKLNLDELRDVDYEYTGLLTPEEIAIFLRYNRSRNAAILPEWCSFESSDEKSA